MKVCFLFFQQKTGNAIRALGRITSLQKLIKGSPPGGGNASASLSSASGSGSNSSSLSSMGSQSTLIDAKNNSVTKNTSNSLKESTVELEKVVTTGNPNLTNHKKDDSSVLTNHNGGNFETTNHKTGQDRNVNHQSGKDINSNNKNTDSAKLKSDNSNNERNFRRNISTEKCNNCTESNSVNHINQSASSKFGHPEFTKEMRDCKAFPGDVVRFDIEFIADGKTSVTWFFEDDVVIQDERISIQETSKGCSLIIRNVCEDDDGEYSCKIKNKIGEEMCSAELIVYGAL